MLITLQNMYSGFCWYLSEVVLLIVCLFTGQLILVSYTQRLKRFTGHRAYKAVYITLTLLVFAIHLAPIILIILEWAICPLEVFGFCYLFNVEKTPNNTNRISTVILREVGTAAPESDPLNRAQFLSDSQVTSSLSHFERYARSVILIFAISSLLSYALIQFALIKTYMYIYRQKDHGQDSEQQDQPTILEPFCTESIERTNPSTRLPFPETLYFNILLLINLALWIACVVIFIVEQCNYVYYNTSSSSITAEAIGFTLYMYSLLCSIASCFLFSKLAYGVTDRCLKLADTLCDADVCVAKVDKHFIDTAKATLNGFEVWFTVYWVCYTISFFFFIALVLDAVSKVIHASPPNPPDSADGFSAIEIVILAMFTISLGTLFLYPCFKAAAITVSREKAIKKVNEKMTRSDKQNYIQYLKNKKFGFHIRLFYAEVCFSYNIAYVAIFISLLGVLPNLIALF